MNFIVEYRLPDSTTRKVTMRDCDNISDALDAALEYEDPDCGEVLSINPAVDS